jgi:hypothetical protein
MWSPLDSPAVTQGWPLVRLLREGVLGGRRSGRLLLEQPIGTPGAKNQLCGRSLTPLAKMYVIFGYSNCVARSHLAANADGLGGHVYVTEYFFPVPPEEGYSNGFQCVVVYSSSCHCYWDMA